MAALELRTKAVIASRPTAQGRSGPKPIEKAALQAIDRPMSAVRYIPDDTQGAPVRQVWPNSGHYKLSGQH